MNKFVVKQCAKWGQQFYTNQRELFALIRILLISIFNQKEQVYHSPIHKRTGFCWKPFWPLLKGQIIWLDAEILCSCGHAVSHKVKTQCYWFPCVWFYSKRHELTYSSCCIMERSPKSPRTADQDTWLTVLKQYEWPDRWSYPRPKISKHIMKWVTQRSFRSTLANQRHHFALFQKPWHYQHFNPLHRSFNFEWSDAA